MDYKWEFDGIVCFANNGRTPTFRQLKSQGKHFRNFLIRWYKTEPHFASKHFEIHNIAC